MLYVPLSLLLQFSSDDDGLEFRILKDNGIEIEI
jgi:hypothetical protein